ncbi:protein kintoun [Ctenocephalides felis]|uniref:protein kintoun n=1 Tax=Ctenocephalides felis TaxID=7515 RepID=UPI000E6E58AF|nr:protein kintoun [Ctenocephalides felis]
MQRSSRLEDLDITREELDKIGESLKNEKFRELFGEYIKEISDPENKKIYEKELTQLERDRGVDIKFVHPQPGYVLKTCIAGEKRAFINICYNDLMKVPRYELAQENNKSGVSWSIPYSLSEAKEDYDKKYKIITIYDVVFHPTALDYASKNPKFKQLLNDTACDGIEKQFQVQLDRKNLKLVKGKYKGMAMPTVIRKDLPGVKPDPKDIEYYDQIYPKAKKAPPKVIPESPCVKLSKPDDSPYTIPKYCIKHRHGIDMQDYTENMNAKLLITVPSHIIVEIQLPMLKSANGMDLDVTEKTIALLCEKPSKYKLNLTLPYPVNADEGVAKFEKDKQRLVITLPVRRDVYNASPQIQQNEDFMDLPEHVDSGVDSDPEIPESEENNSENSKIVVLNETINSELSENVIVQSEVNENLPFFHDDIIYELPKFESHRSENILILIMDVKNILPDSLVSREDEDLFKIKCASVGSGYFTVNYGLCIKINCNIVEFETSIWCNNINVQLTLDDKNIPSEFEAGVNSQYLEVYPMPDNEGSKEYENDSDDSDAEKTTEEMMNVNEKDDSSSSDSSNDVALENAQSRNNLSVAVKERHEETTNNHNLVGHCQINRFYNDSDILSDVPRGILKSSANSEDLTIHDSNSLIIEEDTENKKSVKFEDNVQQNVYRKNSSIVGQKLKNQRKQRNKKRAKDLKKAKQAEEKEVLRDFILQNEHLKGLPINDEEVKEDYISFQSDLIVKLDM